MEFSSEYFTETLLCYIFAFYYYHLLCERFEPIVRSLSAKYRPHRYRRDKRVKFGTELP